jgi:anti-sigma factor RsiW
MCDERERLIGYVYDECEPAERRAIENHLEECDECRGEIGALRSVRQDLLAWAVPPHEAVWRPFAPAPVVPWYRQVPAWAMAAAAGVMFLVGAAGGVVTHGVLFPRENPAATAVTATAAPAAQRLPVGVTPSDLTEVEQRMVQMLRDELGKREAVRTIGNPRIVPASMSATLTQDQLNELIGASEQRQWDMVRQMNNDFFRQITSLKQQVNGLKQEVVLLQSGGGR